MTQYLINWVSPRQDWIKVNTDRAQNSNTGQAMAGGVIRNWCGKNISGFSVHIGLCSITTADLWGIWEGLNLALDLGFRRVELESDSSCTINLVNQKSPKCHRHTQLVIAIQDLLHRDWGVSCNHIYREANFAANFMAQYTSTMVLGSHRFMHLPAGLSKWLSHDEIGVGYNHYLCL